MFKHFLPRLREKSLAAKRPMSMADLMEDFWREPMFGLPNLFRDASYPAVDVSEADGVVTVKAELPGLDPKDVTITIENEALVLRGEKKFEDEEKKEDYHRIERAYGSFARIVPPAGQGQGRGHQGPVRQGRADHHPAPRRKGRAPHHHHRKLKRAASPPPHHQFTGRRAPNGPASGGIRGTPRAGAPHWPRNTPGTGEERHL